MNSLIESLNQLGGQFLSFAWPMLWQSSLLIAGLFAVDLLFRRKIRASIRYALWLVVLVKLCVPPTLALPTSPAWWLHKTPPPVAAKAEPRYTVTYDNAPLPGIPQSPLPAFVPPKPAMMIAAWLLVISAAVSSALLCWLLVRWWQVARLVCRAATAEQFSELLGEALRLAGAPVSDPACSSSFLKRAGSETGVPGAWQTSVRLKLVEGRMSPAVCGLLRPVILLPRSLAERLSAGQLRAVLLHELIHLRRRDVWLNFLQALLQIIYWWHPLVWLANARIRRVREEAVDDAVMLALRDEAESYAPTLLEVARLALNRPLVSLGLVGIMESRHSLRQRIERLVDFHPPRQAGLTLVSLLGILAFTAVAVPMGDEPSPAEKETLLVPPVATATVAVQNTNAAMATVTGILTDPNFRVVIKALQQRTGVETLSEPEVITRSGGHGINRITADNISVPLPNYFSASPSQTTMTFKLNHPISSEELKVNLLEAGVKMPPTIFYYKDDGMLLVRGSREQLTLVDRMMLKLNGFSSKEIEASNEQFVKEIGKIEVENLPVSPMTNLLSRHFRVAAKTFIAALHNTPGLQTNDVPTMARSLFSKLGIDIDLPGKAVFYSDGLGELFVRATKPDLDVIEQALAVLLSAPPQVHIKARFLEVPKGTLSGMQKLRGLTNTTDGMFVGILSSTNAKAVLHALSAGKGSEILAEPEVVTISGRQTKMRATVGSTMITNFVFEQNLTNSWIRPQTSPMETGSILDVVPKVLADGTTIDLKTTASQTEFWGYAFIPTNAPLHSVTNSAGEEIDLPLIWPALQISRESAHVNLRDGQTLVLSLNSPEQIRFGEPDEKREAVVAKHIRDSQKKNKGGERETIVFITATLVDPAGNRVHADDEMPSAKDRVPPQAP